MRKYLVSDQNGTIILFDDKPELYRTRMKSPSMWFKSDNAKGDFIFISEEKSIKLCGRIPTYGEIITIET